MAKQGPKQARVIERVMAAFKQGELESNAGIVRNPKQAIAIALSEAGASREQTPQQNRRRLARSTGGKPLPDPGETRAALYAEARRRGIKGCSRLDKAGLRSALQRSTPEKDKEAP